MSTPHAHFGFNFETNTLVESAPVTSEIPITKKKRMGKNKKVVGGKVKIRLGKKKVVSLSPSTLIGHIPNNKLKAAARSVIRHQSSGGSTSSKRRGRKGKKKSGKKKKVTTFIV